MPFLINKGIKHIIYPDGYIYHIYIYGNHEKWSKHEKDDGNLEKCDYCNKFENYYYKLESKS